MAHRPRRWRSGRHERRRLTDKPSTMPRAIHAAIHQARANARGAFILGDSERTLPAMGCLPAQHLYEDAGAMLPSGEDRTQRWPWLVVNPGEGTACASGFMAATVRPKQFPRRCAPSSRSKFFGPSGPPRCCGRHAVQPARPSPGGSPTRTRWARSCNPERKLHHG